METVLNPGETTPIELTRDVVAFFDALRAEQARFLDAMAQARAGLSVADGHLAQISAVHTRLTRQFFDAQRFIMQRRAEADAEVAQIAAETDEHANTVLASALAHSAAASMPAVDHRDPVAADRDMIERTTRSAAIALSALAARTRHDAEAIERVVNEAFEVRESQDARFERQLQSVLDEWWAFEKQESKALVDDARARAAMRLHLAHMEACELMDPITAEPPTAVDVVDSAPAPAADASVALPAPSVLAMPVDLPAPGASSDAVRALLDRVDATDIESLFSGLESLLAAAPVAPVQAVDESEVIARFLAPDATEAADPFAVFWSATPIVPSAVTTEIEPSAYRSIMTRVVVPIGVVTALLAALMAWIG